MRVDGPIRQKTVDDFVADELGVVTADFAVDGDNRTCPVLTRKSARGQFLGLYLEMRSIT